MRPKVGDVFGRLTVINPTAPSKNKQAMANCLCECGSTKDVACSYLRRGLVRSCGCLSRETTGNISRTHGLSKTPEYAVWCRMHARCSNPNVQRYSRYGGRGIKVCEHWGKFENFLADMGKMPTRLHSLGRIDNDGDYEPANCRWETRREQANNTSANRFVEKGGERKTISQWADELGVSANRISQRLLHGMPIDKVLSTKKSLTERPIEFGCKIMLTTEWMRELSIPISSFYFHKRKGRSEEQILEMYARKRSVQVAPD